MLDCTYQSLDNRYKIHSFPKVISLLETFFLPDKDILSIDIFILFEAISAIRFQSFVF
jgi:hypothetical protein